MSRAASEPPESEDQVYYGAEEEIYYDCEPLLDPLPGDTPLDNKRKVSGRPIHYAPAFQNRWP